MFARLADALIRWRIPTLAVVGVVVAICATFVPQLGFDFTPQQLFRSSSDELDYREMFAERFGREDNVVFVIVETDDVYDPELLEYLRESTLTMRGWPEVKTAESIATVRLPNAGESAGVLSTEPVVPQSGDVTAADAAALKDLATGEPLVEGRLVDDKGEVTVLLVWLEAELQDVKDLSAAVERITNHLEESKPPPNVSTRLGGVPYLRSEIVDSLKVQQLTFIPATAVAYMLILLVLFRRFSGVALPMGVVGVAALMTVAMLVLTDSSINIINNVLPSLIFIIGVSDSIHMLARDGEEMAAGRTREESIRAMVKHTGVACLLTTGTTAVGFFSLLAADTQILQDFGWQAGTGVMFAYVATVLFLPAALVFLKPVRRDPIVGGPDKDPLIERSLRRVGIAVLGRPKTSIAVGLAVTAAFAWAGSTVRIDTILLEVYEPGHPTFQTTRFLEERLGGILPVEVSLEADSADAFKDPETFAKMREIQRFAEESDVVLSTSSLVDYHQAARVALLGSEDQRDVMPQSRAEIEQIQLLLEGGPDDKTGTAQFVTPDFKHGRILLRVSDAGARAQMALGAKLNDKMAELFPPESGISYRLTGDAYVASKALDSFIRDLFYSLLLAVAIIFVMMTFVFRSLKIGLVSTIPNLIPLVMTFGYMGVMDINLNTTTIITFAISLGLAVDDTIHFLARFREEQEVSENTYEALLNTYDGAGRAIMLTSVMLLIGLSILLMSDFMPTRYFGTLTGITIFGAVFGDLLLLPPLLLLIYGDSEADRSSDAVETA
jgi:hydrophobe/amphiphile efflux-3 (HAE3) family protein